MAELSDGGCLITVGVAESWRRPASRTGLLLVGAGIGWFFTEWDNPGLGSPAAFTFGLIFSVLAAPLVAHAALAYSAGPMGSRVSLGAELFAYAGAGLMLGLFPALFFDPPRQGCGLCPANLVRVHSEPRLVDNLLRCGLVLGLAWAAGLIAAGAFCMARASPPLRRRQWPVLVPAGAYLVLVAADFAHSLPRGTLSNDPVDYRLWLWQSALLVMMALGVALALVRDRRVRSAVVRLVMEAAQSPQPGVLRDVLAEMLADTGLELAYPVEAPRRYVRADGQPARTIVGNGEDVTSLFAAGEWWRSCGTELAFWTTQGWSKRSRPPPGWHGQRAAPRRSSGPA